MPTWANQLPVWAVLVALVVYIVVREVVPRINKPPAPSKPAPSSPSIPSMQSMSSVQASERAELAASVERFEAALERHFEMDRQQLQLTQSIADQLTRQGHAMERVAQILDEMRGTIRVLATTQETLLRRASEDTGRFRPLSGG